MSGVEKNLQAMAGVYEVAQRLADRSLASNADDHGGVNGPGSRRSVTSPPC